MMENQRVLYICPSTQAAIVAAAPFLAKGCPFRITHLLILRGIGNPIRPTDADRKDAIRPSVAIEKYAKARGAHVAVLNVSPADTLACRVAVEDYLSGQTFDEIDAVLLNAQAGTKQMCFGAWEALCASFSSADRSNLPVSRCFVSNGKLQIDGGPSFELEPLGITQYVGLYGFREVGENSRIRTEMWIRDRREFVARVATAKLENDEDAVRQVLDLEYDRTEKPPWSRRDFAETGGYWLECHLAVQAHRLKTFKKLDVEIQSGVKIRDLWSVADEKTHKGNNDYELDLMISAPGATHIFECKDRLVTGAMIEKMALLRDRLQGRAGITAIISTSCPDHSSMLADKAHDLAVRLIPAERSAIHAIMDQVFP